MSLGGAWERYGQLPRRHLSFLLENHSEHDGWPTLLGTDPFALLWAKDDQIHVWWQGEHVTETGDPLVMLDELLRRSTSEGFDPETTCAVGMLGYELNRHVESIPTTAQDDQGFPDLLMGFFDAYQTQTAEGLSKVAPSNPRPRAAASWDCPGDLPQGLERNFTRGDYLSAVDRAREFIRAGEIYQVNLSQRFVAPMRGSSFDLYRRLSELSPAPFAALLEFGPRAVVSSSPELFLHVDGRRIQTRPIKGTRPRGRDRDEDEWLYRQLVQSDKDQAELVMIVDLERNDLGRICEPGSVVVTQAREIEAHPSVWHSVATVEGTLRQEITTLDVLRATFPCGSITGAPKVRSMEIIDQLEPTTRGIFTGAIGAIRPSGDMCLNVAIRTIAVHGDVASLQAGGGIVWDSVAEQEYQETLDKARAMARACGIDLED